MCSVRQTYNQRKGAEKKDIQDGALPRPSTETVWQCLPCDGASGRCTLHSEGSLRRPPTLVPPTSCTLSGLGPGWARFQNIDFNHSFSVCWNHFF